MPLRCLRQVQQQVQQRSAFAPHQTILAGSIACFAVSAVAYTSRKRAQESRVFPTCRRCLHPLAVQAISGATAEVCENFLGYPFATLRVKCQAHNLSTWTVLRQLHSHGSKRVALKTLYSGVGLTTIGSILIGAIYLSSFTFLNDQFIAAQQHLARRAARRKLFVQFRRQKRKSCNDHAAGEPPFSSRSTDCLSSCSNTVEQTQYERVQQDNAGTSPSSNRATSITEANASENTPTEPMRLLTEFSAAALASMSTALIEGPLDIFQTRIQAGSSAGGIAGTMHAAVGGGIGPLFNGVNGFLLKGITRDVVELVAYSQLRILKEQTDKGKRTALLQQLPDEVKKVILGASAGALAVLVSMPLTCIKTVIDTRCIVPPRGLLPTLRTFWLTGHEIVAAGGAQALFRGLLPQMVETIPSVGMYWLAVECTRRLLAPYTMEGSCATESSITHNAMSANVV